MSKKKHKPIKIPRSKVKNPYAVDAKARKAGPMKLDKNKKEKQKQKERKDFQEEFENE